MLENNKGETETQCRNNSIDMYQIQLRSNSEESIDGREGCKMDVEIRMSILIQTGDIYR